MPIALDDYRLLGRSGLRVSPLALGTMTFGVDAGWRFNKVDNVGSVSGTGSTGIASNPKDVAPYSELRIATTYSLKF